MELPYDLSISNILVSRGILTENEGELYRHLCQRNIPSDNSNTFRMNYSSRYDFVKSAYLGYMSSINLRTQDHELVLTSKVKFKLENILLLDEDVLNEAIRKIFESEDRYWMLPILSLERQGEYFSLDYTEGDPVTEWNYPEPFLIDGYEVEGTIADDDNEFRMKARKVLLKKLTNGDNHIRLRYQALAYLLTRNLAVYPYDTLKPKREDIVAVMVPKQMIPMIYPPDGLPNYLLVSSRIPLEIPVLVQRYFYCLGEGATTMALHRDTSQVLFPLFNMSVLNHSLLKVNQIGFVTSSSIYGPQKNNVFENGRNLRLTNGLILRCNNTYFPFDLMGRNTIIPRHYQLVKRKDNTIVPFLHNKYYYKNKDGEFTGSSYSCKYQDVVPWEFKQKSNVKFSLFKSLMAVVYHIRNNIGVYVKRNNRFERIGYQNIELNTISTERFRVVEAGKVKHNVYGSRVRAEYLEPDTNGTVYLLNDKYVTQEYFDNIHHQVPGMIETRLFTLDEPNMKYRKFLEAIINAGFLMPHVLELIQGEI